MKSSKFLRHFSLAIGLILFFCLVLSFGYWRESYSPNEEKQTIPVKRQDIEIQVKTIGELEAARSHTIASTVKGDNAKIIYLIADGSTVENGAELVRIDPTPFEEKLTGLKIKLDEQIAYSKVLEKSLAWEISQAEKDDKMMEFEVEAFELELIKIKDGDGPLEISRLKTIMQKALNKFNEIEGYSHDLHELEKEGYLNPSEVRNAQKKLDEEREAFEAAKLQYESYLNHVFPMQVKKAEAALKQARIRLEETNKIRGHSVAKAMLELNQARQAVESIYLQIKEAEKELDSTIITAPTSGMVVHREEYRNGQRRKPRIGDIAVRNQPLLDLPDLKQMIVKSKVREVDLCKVSIGKQATVEIDAYPDISYKGEITSIGVLALPDLTRASEEKYFEIRIQLDSSDSHVRPGMTARAIIHSQTVTNALTVPIHSVFLEQGKALCYVSSHLGYEKRPVMMGLSNETEVEIKQGLNEGETVCLNIPKEMR